MAHGYPAGLTGYRPPAGTAFSLLSVTYSPLRGYRAAPEPSRVRCHDAGT